MKKVELGKLVRSKIKSIDPKKNPDGEFALCSIAAFDNGEPEFVTGKEIGSSKKLLKHGDVVISRIVPHIKRVWVIPNISGKQILGSGEWIVFNSENVDPNYLKSYLLSETFHRKFMQTVKGVGGSLLRADPKQTGKIQIPLPPLPIQRKIAEALDKADAIRKRSQQILAKYDQLAQSVFLEMFGDPVKNEKGWQTKTVEDFASKQKHSIKRGPFGGALKKEIFVDKGYLVYEQFHALNNDFSMERYFIDEAKYQEMKAFDVKPFDIIISCSGVYLGKLAIVPKNAKPGIINQALLKLTLNQDRMVNEFFVFHFRQESFRMKFFDANRGAGIPNFPPMSAFKSFPFIFPPIELQNEFATIISKLEKQKSQTQMELDRAEELYQSLLQKAFSGELFNSSQPFDSAQGDSPVGLSGVEAHT